MVIGLQEEYGKLSMRVNFISSKDIGQFMSI